jgi:tetratricopeptide (TPR) repeat protein
VQRRDDPPNALLRSQLSFRIGAVLAEEGNLQEALQSLRDSLAIADSFNKAAPDDTEWQNQLALTEFNICYVLGEKEAVEEALAACRKGLVVYKLLMVKEGANTWEQSDIRFAIETFGGLAYRLVLARRFDRALEVVDEAISVAPDLTLPYTNRAHALMFLSRTAEARALYLQFRGKHVGEELWEAVILRDFADLRRSGLANPLMNEIERRFAAHISLSASGRADNGRQSSIRSRKH